MPASATIQMRASQTFIITVLDPVRMVTETLPPMYVGVPYSYQLRASGGNPPYTFSGTGLPPGITVSPDGLVSGTPTLAGTFTAELSAEDKAS